MTETPQRYFRVTIDNRASCICATRADVDDLLDGSESAAQITEVFMTVSEYEKLPEFEGF